MKLSKSVKTLVLSALLTTGVVLAAQSNSADAAQKKPNFLVFLTDDAGMDQLRLYGYNSTPAAAPTPNLVSL